MWLWVNRFFCFLCLVIIPAFTAEVQAQSAIPESDQQKIEIYLGERRTLAVDGTEAFVADEDILQVEKIVENKITVTAVRGGKTQILFWKDGVLHFLDIEVKVPPSLSVGAMGPRFQGTKPYFIYEVQNTSSFSKSSFFKNPGTSHLLQMEDPVRSNARLRSSFGIRHDSLETPDWTAALVSYQSPTRYLTFGQTSTSLSRAGNEALLGTSFLGSNLTFKTPLKTRFQKELNLFGGVRPSLNLLESDTQNQIYGASASIIRYTTGKQKPDLANVSVFTYQPYASNQFKPGGLAEAQYRWGKNFSLGGSALRADGGISGMLQPFWESERTLSSLKYSFIQNGLKVPLAQPLANDLHRYTFFHQHMLKDKVSAVGASFAQDYSIQALDSIMPSSQNTRGTLYYRKQKAFQRGYGLQYGMSHSSYLDTEILLNTMAANYTHPVKPGNYFQHNLGFTRGDLSIAINQVTASSSFTHEGPSLRSTTSLGMLVNRGDSRIDSIIFNESFIWNFKHGFYQMGFGYLKADARDGNHQFQFSPSWNYYLATTHLITVGTNFLILAGDPRETFGNFNIRYRYLFGPGVQPDSLFKNIFKGGMNQPVLGQVFMDRNYSDYFDEGDTPLSGVPVRLGDKIVNTDAAGRFNFSNVRSGQYVLSLDPNSLGLQQPVDLAYYQNVEVKGRQPLEVPIAVTVKKADLRVKVRMDVNGNGEIDEEDPVYMWPKLLVTMPTGERRRVSMSSGEAIVRGVDPGQVIVALDSNDVPDTVEIHGPLEQSLTITAAESLEAQFLVSPLRTVRGRLMLEKYKLKKAFVVIGGSRSEVDEQGFFWVKNIPAGTHIPHLENSQKLCLKNPQALDIPAGPFTEIVNYTVTNECSPSPSSPW